MVRHNTKWKTLAKYELTLRMHFPNDVSLVHRPLARWSPGFVKKARSSSLIPSDLFKPVCCKSLSNKGFSL